MWVVDQLHDRDLALDPAMYSSPVLQGSLGDDLDRNLLIGFPMASKLDAALRCDEPKEKQAVMRMSAHTSV